MDLSAGEQTLTRCECILATAAYRINAIEATLKGSIRPGGAEQTPSVLRSEPGTTRSVWSEPSHQKGARHEVTAQSPLGSRDRDGPQAATTHQRRCL